MDEFDRRGYQPTESWHGEAPPPSRSAPDAADPEIPERYELGAELGRGGMAIVYAAHDRQLDRRVALKVLQPHRRSDDLQKRLVREAQALAKLRHPAVVTVYDVTMHRGRVFVAMELVEGATLRTWATSGRSLTDKLAACITAGRGLAAVHAAGLVHRDFKPDNVLVGDDGAVRVADFGLARLARAEAITDDIPPSAVDDATPKPPISETLTHAGSIVGTLAYMAPETLRGEPADARSDQFAFAITLVEILGGARPFAGDSRESLLAAIDRPPAIPDAVPKRIRAIAARALARDPAARYPSLAVMLDELARTTGSRRRPVVVAGVLAVVGAGGAVTAALLARAPDRATCDVPAALHSAWTPARAGVLRSKLEALAPATAIGSAVTSNLDKYRERLVGAYAHACELRKSESPEIAALRAACLDRRTSALAQVVDALDGVDAKSVGRAVATVEGLGAVDDCASVALLGARVPRKPSQAVEGAAIDRELSSARAWSDLGRHAEAQAKLDAVQPRVVALAHPPTESEYLLSLSTVLEGLDKVADAEAALRKAVVLAQTGKDDALVVRSATNLALNVGRIQRKPAEARTWLDLAFATVNRMPPTPELESRVRFAFAILDLASHDPDAAEPHATRAYELCTQLYTARSAGCADMLNTLGGIALDRRDLDLAFERYSSARDVYLALQGDRNPGTLTTTSNLASVAYARGDFAKSAELRQWLVDRAVATLGPQHYRVGNTALLLGLTLEQMGKLPEAIAATQRGLAIVAESRGPDFERTLEAKVQLARQQVASGDRAAIALAREAAEHAKVTPAVAIEALEVELALAYAEQRFADARTAGERALALVTDKKLERVEGLVRIALAVAMLQREAKLPAAAATADLAVRLAEQYWGATAPAVVAARAERAKHVSPAR